MLKKLTVFLPILMLVACQYDISGAAMMEITERFEDEGNSYIRVKNQGDEVYTLEVDENVFNLVEVNEEYFVSYKSDNDRVGILETIELK